MSAIIIIIITIIVIDIFTFSLDIIYVFPVRDSPTKYLPHATQHRFYLGSHHPLGIGFALEIGPT